MHTNDVPGHYNHRNLFVMSLPRLVRMWHVRLVGALVQTILIVSHFADSSHDSPLTRSLVHTLLFQLSFTFSVPRNEAELWTNESISCLGRGWSLYAHTACEWPGAINDSKIWFSVGSVSPKLVSKKISWWPLMAPTLMALSDVFLSFLTFFLGIPAPTSGYIVWILCSAKFFIPWLELWVQWTVLYYREWPSLSSLFYFCICKALKAGFTLGERRRRRRRGMRGRRLSWHKNPHFLFR